MIAAGALIASCSLDVGGVAPPMGQGQGGATTGDSASSSTAAATAASSGGSVDGGRAACPTGLAGPALILIDGPQGSYCIDSTEVTSADYKTWLDATPVPLSPPNIAECGWNKDYKPAMTGVEDCKPEHYDPIKKPTYPVACVDWCDAYDYCRWAGKHLCGKIGGGRLDDFNDYKDPAKSEWMQACSANGSRQFPYGEVYQKKTCLADDENGVVGDGELGEALPVKSKAGCVGGYPDLFDMSGNVWEWEDTCLLMGNPEDDRCRARGGSFWDDVPLLGCGSDTFPGHTRQFANKNVGFRCCADVVK